MSSRKKTKPKASNETLDELKEKLDGLNEEMIYLRNELSAAVMRARELREFAADCAKFLRDMPEIRTSNRSIPWETKSSKLVARWRDLNE